MKELELTPKQKAEELFNKIGNENQEDYCYNVKEATRKQALILCDEVSENLEYLCVSHLGTYRNPKISFWEQVKEEINKIN